MISILNLEPEDFSIDAMKILKSLGNVHNGPLIRRDLLKKLDCYDALIVRLAHNIDREIIDAARNLKVISSATTGLNHIDVNYAEKKDIKILSLKGETAFLNTIHATAEHTWALILSLIRKIPQAYSSVLDGKWDRYSYKGKELNGATIGIVGLGRIGKKIANYAISFGMKVLAFTKEKYVIMEGISIVDSLDELIENSDIISIHVPLNSSTNKMFGRNEFKRFNKGSLLINTSRGDILDENELLRAIKNGNLSGVALDVIENEFSFNDHKRRKLIEYAKKNSNIIITPHLGGATFESMKKTEIFMANKMKNYFKQIK